MSHHQKLTAALELVASGAVTVTELAGYKRLHGAADLIHAIIGASHDEPPLVSIKPKYGKEPVTLTDAGREWLRDATQPTGHKGDE